MSNKKLLDWVEQNANEALKFSLSVTESLLKDATFLLNILIAGIGGAITLTASIFHGGGDLLLAVPAGVSGLYLVFVGYVLLHKVIRTADFFGPGNLPSNLYQPKHSLLDLKEAELMNVEIKKDSNSRRNTNMAQWLDRCRYMTLLTPLVFIAAGLAVYLVRALATGALAVALG